jgi:hypothetical protein
MAWPDYESLLPAALRGGPIPPDVSARTWVQLREAWRRHLARRVHGAEVRALALVVLPDDGLPQALIFDGRTCEVATPLLPEPVAGSDALLQLATLPRTGMVMRQGGVLLWRESLSVDLAEARWRQLGGDEAFALAPPRLQPRLPGAPRAYALVRRGGDHAHVELAPGALGLPEPSTRWAVRLLPYLRPDLRPWFAVAAAG